MPRVLFDTWTAEDYKAVLTNSDELKAMTKTLVEACKKHNFDGFVFEVWSQIAGAIQSEILVKFIQSMSGVFRENNLEFILVIPPKRGEHELFTSKDFDGLYDHVTAFSLMTYDYSNPQMPGNSTFLYNYADMFIIIGKVRTLLWGG